MGGVRTGRDALELIAAGARHVALGTTLFADPDAPARVRRELVEAAGAAGFVHPDNAFACAHGDDTGNRKTPHVATFLAA
jgi:dihydroorotate dehydrogenase (NAD+) catalytic subunit